MDRKMRYLDKLAYVGRRISNVEAWLPKSDDQTARLAIYKALQEIVEAIFDVTSMKHVDLRAP